MQKNLFRKEMVLIIIIMFIGMNINPSISSMSERQSIKPISNGNTLYVGGTGLGNYTTIQDAIDNASDGDTIFVFNGTYHGYIIINKSINMIGEDKNTTFITGYVAFTISIISDWVNFSGFTIQNDGLRGEGVRIDSSNNNFFNNIINTPNDNIRISGDYNNILTNTITGDSLILSGDRNTISANTITNNYHGIYLTEACENIISNNSFFKSGLFISEDTVWHNIVINNMMNGKPLVYLLDESDLLLNVDSGQIIIVNCTNITVQNQEIFNTTVGIQIWGSNSCVISNNTMAGNYYGIYIKGLNNSIKDNTITNNNNEGIFLFGKRNTISGNTISYNDDGLYLQYNSDNNIIYHNNFVNNTQNAYDEGDNIWDDGYPSGGNYWDDYTGEDNDGDGIGDTPYPIPGSDNEDRYPLITPYVNQAPVVKIINPKKGYFHYSGIQILPTLFDLIADTMSIDGFRRNPIIINATDDSDNRSDLIVKVYLDGEEQGIASYCCDWRLHEWFWTERALGSYILTITAEDSFGAIGSAEIEVWNFCLRS